MALHLEPGVDRTVRSPGLIGWGNDGSYRGPDHCSFKGAMALVQRLKSYWNLRGERRFYEVYPARSWTPAEVDAVYGVRELKTPAVLVALPKVTPIEQFYVGETPRRKIKRLIAETAYRNGSSYEEVMRGEGAKPHIQKARRACICAVYDLQPQKSFPEVAAIFNCHHASIIYAVNEQFRGSHTKRTLAHYHAGKVAA